MFATSLESPNMNSTPVSYAVPFDAIMTYQDDGMRARSQGIGYESNPFLVRTLMPQVTGEPVVEWRQKAEAWLFGWLMENAWCEAA
jgi:hypothetical protein